MCMDYSSLLIREVIDRVSKLRLLSVYNESIKGDLESTILPLYQQHFENKDVNEALRILKKRLSQSYETQMVRCCYTGL